MQKSRLWMLLLSGSGLLVMAAPLAANHGTLLSRQVEPKPETVIAVEDDAWNRMTVPVMVNGKGPFPFVIDTGADRSVISVELAAELGLVPQSTAVLHSISGASDVSTTILSSLTVGGVTRENVRAPMLPKRHLGGMGLLGIDSLYDKRIVMDFVKQQIAVYPSSGATDAPDDGQESGDVIVVRARSKYGQLVLVDADANGRKINVVLDSGAQNSIGNNALRTMMSRRAKDSISQVELVGVTGKITEADFSSIGAVRIGGFTFENLPVAFAEAHPFRKFGLEKRPAMLLGMDALRMFDRVSVDFGTRKVRFVMPDAL